jgi:rhamnosyl/mannosyltransferase
MRARGHTVDVIAGANLPRILVADVRLAPLLPQWGWVRERARQADVVSLHGPIPAFSDFALLMTGRDRAVPPVAYLHHFDIRFRRLGWAADMYASWHRRLAERADGIMVSTEAFARSFRPRARDKMHVIPFGVDSSMLVERKRAAEFTVLFVGQMRPYKGIDVLLKAMTKLPCVKLKIAGHGFAGEQYRQMARELGLTNVEFLGTVSDEELWELYATSHVQVLPSTEMEYFGLVLLEGMLSGCVPVISDLPGPVEVIGDVGKVVPRFDARALARAIQELAEDPADREARSKRARARAAEFTWDRCVDAHLALYERLAG